MLSPFALLAVCIGIVLFPDVNADARPYVSEVSAKLRAEYARSGGRFMYTVDEQSVRFKLDEASEVFTCNHFVCYNATGDAVRWTCVVPGWDPRLVRKLRRYFQDKAAAIGVDFELVVEVSFSNM